MTKREWLEEAERWLKQAEHNRRVAIHDQAGGFHDAACFWAQQTAEAALKAFLYAGGLDVRGYSIADLAERAAGLDVGYRQLVDELSPLDQYYIPTRYPNGLVAPSIPARAFNRQDSNRALELADRVLGVVKEKIKFLRALLEQAERKESSRSREREGLDAGV